LKNNKIYSPVFIIIIAALASALFTSVADAAWPVRAAQKYETVESALAAGGGPDKIAARLVSGLASCPEQERDLSLFEIFAVRKDFPAAAKYLKSAFESRKRSDGFEGAKYFDEILKTYAAFAQTLSPEDFSGIAPVHPGGKLANPVLKLFYERYAERAERESRRLSSLNKSPDYISFLERQSAASPEGEAASPGAGEAGDFPGALAACLGESMKDADFMNFASCRPLLLFMLYKNIRESGDEFLAEFIKSFIETNVPPSIRRSSGFSEFENAAATNSLSQGASGATLVCDFSSSSFFSVDVSSPADFTRPALVSGTLKKKAVPEADIKKFKNASVLFSDAAIIFPLNHGALASVKFAGLNCGEIAFSSGARVRFGFRKAGGAESASLEKRFKSIRIGRFDYLTDPAGPSYLLQAGSDFLEISFSGFRSGDDAMALLSSARVY